MWEFYTQLVQVEEAFKNLKGDLAIRPIYHQREDRVEAHIFVSFLAYALHVSLRRRLKDLAPGLTPRAVLEKFFGNAFSNIAHDVLRHRVILTYEAEAEQRSPEDVISTILSKVPVP